MANHERWTKGYRIDSADRRAIKLRCGLESCHEVAARYGIAPEKVREIFAERRAELGYDALNDATREYRPDPNRTRAVLPAPLPGSFISAPTRDRLMAGR